MVYCLQEMDESRSWDGHAKPDCESGNSQTRHVGRYSYRPPILAVAYRAFYLKQLHVRCVTHLLPTHLHFHMANMEGRNNKSYYGAAFGGPCMASSYRRPFCSDSREPRFARIPSILKVVSEQEKDLCTSAAATRSCVG